MLTGRRCCRALAGALFAGSGAALPAIQVVGDAACGYYDVDIAAFATCVDQRVVKPDAAPAVPPAPPRDATATPKAIAIGHATSPQREPASTPPQRSIAQRR